MATIERRQLKHGISFRVEWRHNGERKRLTYDSEADALEWKHLIEAAGGDSEKADKLLLDLSSKAPKLSEVAVEHIDRLIDVTPYTKSKYRQQAKTHYAAIDMPVDRITQDDITRWVAWMAEQAPNGRSFGYAPKTIKNSHALLHSILSYAVKRRYCASNPADDTRLPRKVHASDGDKFLTVEEFATLLPYFSEKHRPAMRFFYATGLRAGELLALTPEDFTVVDGTTYVRISKATKQMSGGKGAYIGEPKTNKSRRTVDIDDATMEHVWPLVRSAGHGNPVFPAGPVRLADRYWKISMKPAVARARAGGFTKNPGLHSLRHSHAAHMLSLGMPIHELSWRLGHSSIQVTIDQYGHLTTHRRGSASKLFAGGSTILEAPLPLKQLESH